MPTPRTLVLTAAVAALAVAPLTLAGSAQAAPAYSVTVEHCGGGIAVVGYSTMAAANRANTRVVARQKAHPGSLHVVQLRKGAKVIKASTKHC